MQAAYEKFIFILVVKVHLLVLMAFQMAARKALKKVAGMVDEMARMTVD